jgi:hypothetical protein
MNNTDIIVQDTSRKGIDRCNCPKCKGCAGTARVCFNSRKLASRALGNALTKTAGQLLLLSCFFLQGPATADVLSHAVGPRPHGNYENDFSGSLIVYSRTEQTQWGDGTYFYPHTAYWIYNTDGKKIKTVENHGSSIDEAPERVELTPGTYTVKAWSDHDGLVTVPVVIKRTQITKVHLENGRDSDKEAIDSARAVTTRSGQLVGWKA